MSHKSEELGWMNVVVRVGLNACTHPVEYAKVLIQVSNSELHHVIHSIHAHVNQLYYM